MPSTNVKKTDTKKVFMPSPPPRHLVLGIIRRRHRHQVQKGHLGLAWCWPLLSRISIAKEMAAGIGWWRDSSWIHPSSVVWRTENGARLRALPFDVLRIETPKGGSTIRRRSSVASRIWFTVYSKVRKYLAHSNRRVAKQYCFINTMQ